MSEKSHHAETLHTSKTAPYRNPELAPEERARDLLGNMTLAEKVAQMMGTWQELNALLFDDKGETDLERIRPLLKNGIGQIGRLSSFNGGLGAEEMAQWANTLQKFIIENTRLGIPAILHEECLHGLAARDATSYPQPIGLASTFNPELVEQIYTAIARDTRARGAHQALTPVVDVAREPRWGRVEETFGEDPYLVSRLGIAAVRGFQGDNTFCNGERVLATLKHYAAHGEPESGTNCAPVNVSERLLRDTFLYTFREVIRHAAPRSVMASYNEIDGVPSHASKWLLRTVLREEWGFTGFVVSDYYAVTELNHKAETVSHAVARDKTEAAALAASAGVNIELPEVDCYPNLISLVEDGLLAEAVIDEMVMPMLLDKFRLGLFENPYVDPKAIDNEAKLRDDRSIARQAARETAVLLKNEGNLLPLRIEDYRTVAVIGPNADRVLLGGYSGKPRYYTSVLEGIRARIGQQAEVLYSEGCRITEGGSWNEDEVHFPDPGEDRQRLENALKVAQKADLIILAIGGNEQTSREAWGKVHLGDRPSLELVGLQNELADRLLAIGKPLVTLLFNGRPKSITALSEKVPALLECWYLGQETGNVVAELLFGDINPSGKLPISFPRSVGHIPCFYNHKPSARRGYLKESVAPLYPFGYGLSYTTFAIGEIKLAKTVISAEEKTSISATLQNTGAVAGAEVVQLYIRDHHSSVTRPVKELKGFKKVFLKPGQKATVVLEIGPDQLAFTNIDMKYTVEPGGFDIMIGTSSRDEDLQKVTLRVE